MQDTMRTKLIGQQFWIDLAERRFHHLQMIDPFYTYKCSRETRKSYRIVYRLNCAQQQEPSEKRPAKRFSWPQNRVANIDTDEDQINGAKIYEGNETAEIECFENPPL